MKKPQYEDGKQIKIICSGCLVWNLDTPQGISSLLNKMCELIRMKALGGPYLAEVKGEGEDDGISGVLIIKESHCSAHAWDAPRAVRITVDSCKDFNEDELIGFLIDELLPDKIRVADEIWRENLV